MAELVFLVLFTVVCVDGMVLALCRAAAIGDAQDARAAMERRR